MALIKCSECSRDVSDQASICPNCGNPINSRPDKNQIVEVITNSQKPISVEPVLISKKWKKVKLWSWAAIIFGFFLMGSSKSSWKSDDLVFWAGFCFVGYGFIVLIIGKIGAWYSDKRAR